jgi:glycosyltransferase involved in cell wall biosynthesis
MQHIVIDARESGTSTGRYIDKLVEHLHSLQPDYRITLLAKPHRLDFYAGTAPRFTAVVCPHKEFSFDEQIDLKRQIEGLKPDLTFFPAVQQPVWYSGRTVTTIQDLTTVRFRNPAKNPLVFTIKQQVYKWVNKRVAHKSAALITPTQFVKDDVVAYCKVDPKKITVTPEAADALPTPAEPVSTLQDTAPYIMYVGRPTPHKNLERLIQAFATLKPAHPDLKLVLVGKKDSNYERIESLVKQQGIANVIFTGFISDQQLRWLYEHCQAYIFPSLSEGFGLPGLEAMLHGAPVVSSNATCLPEVHGDAAQYFNPMDIQDMAANIEIVLNDASLRQELIAKGRQQAAKFSWQRMAKQTLDVFQQALKQ